MNINKLSTFISVYKHFLSKSKAIVDTADFVINILETSSLSLIKIHSIIVKLTRFICETSTLKKYINK